MMCWKEVSWILEHAWNNTTTQRNRPAPTEMMFSVREVVGLFLIKVSNRFVHYVVIPQILFNIPSNLRLCRGSERAPSVSEVLQVTFEDGCCVRRIVRVRRSVHRASRSVQREDSQDRHHAQYLYPAQGWRHRSHHGVRGRPRKSTTGVYSEVDTPRE